MLRKILFWGHFGAGMLLGVFIFLMAVTGVLLTYERQIVGAFETAPVDRPQTGQNVVLDLDDLIPFAAERAGSTDGLILEQHRKDGAPVKIMQGRMTIGYLDPFTGASVDTGVTDVKAFFSTVEGLHRWLALTGSARPIGHSIMSAANVVFFVMAITGAILWLPKLWRWNIVRQRLVLTRNPATPRAKHLNWHYVFGIWAVGPLIVITATAMVFSYDWAEDLVYAIFDKEEATPVSSLQLNSAIETVVSSPSLNAITDRAKQQAPDWRKVRLSVPQSPDEETVKVTLYYGAQGIPTNRTAMTFDRATGALTDEAPFSQTPSGRKARIIIRYLHTGEVFGLIGQTIAGLASLFACLLVYSGFLLGLRRVRSWTTRHSA